MSEYINKEIRDKYISESIISSYLIHIENEILNLELKLKTDITLRYILIHGGISLKTFINRLQKFVKCLNYMINIFKQ